MSTIASTDRARTPSSPAKPRPRAAKAVTAPKKLAESPPADSGSPGIGARLRYLRETFGVSQRELARRSGLNHGTVGCIEKETISPSVGSLRKILDSFPITLSDFFALEPTTEDQVFFANADLMEVGGTGVSLKQVGHNLKNRPLQVLLERYAIGAETAPKPYSHTGDEGGVIIQGQVEVTVGNLTRVLGPGDAYLFQSRMPHRFRNVGTVECIVVSACTPPV